MKKTKAHSSLYFEFDQRMLENFVNALTFNTIWTYSKAQGRSVSNAIDCTPVRDHLRQLVDAWFKSGPNLRKLFNSNQEISRYAKGMRAELIPTNGRRAQLHFEVNVKGANIENPTQLALQHFYLFLLHPENHRLSGPCECCKNYYLKKDARRRTYCSRSCARMRTSRDANRKKRMENREARLLGIRKLLENWPGRKRYPDWKAWLISQNPELTKTLITRLANSGDIVSPA